MSLAIFDLDNTLLAGDSDYLWGQYLVEHNIVDTDYYATENKRYYQEYEAGTLDIYEFLAFSLKPLSEHSLSDLKQWQTAFIESKIRPILLEKALKLIDHHRQKNDTLMIITATNRFVTEPIADILAIPHLLATDPEINENGYTGKVAGTPCFQSGKVKRLEAWLAEHNQSLEGSTFYSDSFNDLPLLKLVDNPVVVDADKSLKEYAEKQQWKIISLR